MNDYTSHVLGSFPGTETTEGFSFPMGELDRQLRKIGKQKGSKKKLKKKLHALEQDRQKLKKMKKKFHKLKKQKKGKKGKKVKKLKRRIQELEQMHEQQQLWLYEAIKNSFPKMLELANTYMNRLPSKEQPLLALPAPQNQK